MTLSEQKAMLRIQAIYGLTLTVTDTMYQAVALKPEPEIRERRTKKGLYSMGKGIRGV